MLRDDPKIVDRRADAAGRHEHPHLVHPDDDESGEPLVADAVVDWIEGQLEHMISARGNDAAEAINNLVERLAGLVGEISRDIAVKHRRTWLQAEVGQDAELRAECHAAAKAVAKRLRRH